MIRALLVALFLAVCAAPALAQMTNETFPAFILGQPTANPLGPTDRGIVIQGGATRQVVPIVAYNNSALISLPTTPSGRVTTRLGYAIVGDSPALNFRSVAATSCGANGLVNDGASCVNANDGGSWIAISGVISKTSNYTVQASDTGTYFDNGNASGEVDFALPPAAVGLNFRFAVTSPQIMKIVSTVNQRIAIGGNNSSAGGNITSNIPFSQVRLYVPAGAPTQWITDGDSVGTWTIN